MGAYCGPGCQCQECGPASSSYSQVPRLIADLDAMQARAEAAEQRVREVEARLSLYQQAVNEIDDYIEHRGPGAFYGGEIDKKHIHTIFAKLTVAIAKDASTLGGKDEQESGK